MNRLVAVCCLIGVVLVGCASDEKKSDNPYQETHIVDVVPNYQITPDDSPKLKKPIEQMTEEELKARYGELQQQSGLSTPQQKEFNLIAERLRQLSEYKLKTDQTIHIKP